MVSGYTSMCTQIDFTRKTAMRLIHVQDRNQDGPMKSHAWCNLCVLSVWCGGHRANETLHPTHQSPT